MSDTQASTFEGVCGSCGMKLELAREYIGKKVQCPGCSNKFVVEDPEAPAAEETVAESPAPAPQKEAPVEKKEPAPKSTRPERTLKKEPVKKTQRKKTEYRKPQNSKSAAAAMEETPDALMSHFEGPGLKPILVFTLIVHVVLLLGTSIPFFISKLTAEDMDETPKEERLDSAVKDATSSIREIAKKYEVNPQELSDRFQKKGGRKAPPKPVEGDTPSTPAPAAANPNTQPTNAIERELSVQEKGPEVPGNIEDEDDLF